MEKDSNDISYGRQAFETYWRTRWEADGLWDIDIEQVDPDEKFYNLVEFPYPSAEGLHVGHVYTYCGADTFSRYKRMCGKKIFQPMGFDSFGIHTENFALRAGVHPQELTGRTIEHYREQLKVMGAAWNWKHEVITSDPDYYRWTQWIFLQFYKAGLAVRKEAPVVWCPTCLTVLAHEQPLVDEWLQDSEHEHEVRAFVKQLQTLTLEMGTSAEGKTEKRGVFVGAYGINPANGDEVPVYVADYVVSSYGTGIVMGVPAHDERDYEFAQSLGLPIRQVIRPEDGVDHNLWTGEGILINSGQFSGLSSAVAKESICEWLEQNGEGRRATQYRMHDWLISRQRYWGPPIPIIYCQQCGTVPVPEEQLPVLLPYVQAFRPTGTDKSPLASVESFVQVTCPVCGGEAQRETDVSDTFVDSSW